ncbi:MAG: hypothetical protein OXD40_09185 [bacterium]|nr:hypothetical protein [bacterium]
MPRMRVASSKVSRNPFSRLRFILTTRFQRQHCALHEAPGNVRTQR